MESSKRHHPLLKEFIESQAKINQNHNHAIKVYQIHKRISVLMNHWGQEIQRTKWIFRNQLNIQTAKYNHWKRLPKEEPITTLIIIVMNPNRFYRHYRILSNKLIKELLQEVIRMKLWIVQQLIYNKSWIPRHLIKEL